MKKIIFDLYHNVKNIVDDSFVETPELHTDEEYITYVMNILDEICNVSSVSNIIEIINYVNFIKNECPENTYGPKYTTVYGYNIEVFKRGKHRHNKHYVIYRYEFPIEMFKLLNVKIKQETRTFKIIPNKYKY